jgi:excisionase family DNA binding protein
MNHDPAGSPRRLLNVRDVAAWLNCSRSTVYRLTSAKSLRPARFRGSLRYTHEEVETFLERASGKDVADQLL